MIDTIPSASSALSALSAGVPPASFAIASGWRRAEEARAEDADDRQVPETAAIAQELRAPLASILGSMRLVAVGALGPVPAEAAVLLSIAGRTCERLIGLLDELRAAGQPGGEPPAKALDPDVLAERVREVMGIG